MTLSPALEEVIARARGDLRIGLPVVLTGDAPALVAAVETLSPARWEGLRALDRAMDLAITSRRADTLRARAYDGDLARVALTGDEGLDWLRATADPAADLASPMKGPYRTRREGSAEAHRAAIALAKRAHLLPAMIVVPLPDAPTASRLGAENGLLCLGAEETLHCRGYMSPLAEVSAARVPLAVSKAGRVHVFRAGDGSEEHYAVEIGRPDRAAPVLCRLHSACFTGDVIGSLKCDCGPQLHAALDHIGEEGAGVLLYLNQEGRGIGLANKMRAYSLQDQGFDTVEANHRLGFEDDERNFRIGSELLRGLGFSAVRLMTNNPRKVAMMEAGAIAVSERVPLRVGMTDENRGYLATKRDKSGHHL